MRLFRCLNYRLTKKDTAGTLFERAKEIASEISNGQTPISFYLEDSSHKKVSAVQRVLKKFPELKKFEYMVAENPEQNRPSCKVLSNRSAIWDKPNPNGCTKQVTNHILHEITNGIPRSYPFKYTNFIFDKINWLKTEIGNQQPAILDRKPFSASPDNYLSPCIIIRSDWWISGRQNELKVVIELKVPRETDEEIAELPRDICSYLDCLGKIKNEFYIAVPNEDESRRIQSISPKAVQLIKEMNNNMSNILKDLSLPYELLDYNISCGTFDSVSLKKEIIKTFKSRKYKYLSNFSGQGVYYLVRRTKTNNQIKLLFDFAPIMRGLSLIFIYQGPFWEYELKLKFSPRQNRHRYPIRGEEVLKKVVSNAGEIVDYLEKTLVMDLDNLYGNAPTWFEYQK